MARKYKRIKKPKYRYGINGPVRLRRQVMASTNVNVKPTTKLFPAIKVVTMKYNDVNSYSGTPAGVYTYRSNALFDPDFTGTGVQCRGYDTLTNLYNKTTVYSCSATITAWSTNANGCYLTAYPTLQPYPTVSTMPDIKPLTEQTGARTIYLPANGTQRTMKVYFSCKNRFGVSMDTIKNDLTVYGADPGSIPSRNGYIVLVGYTGSLNLGTDTTAYTYRIKLRYNSIFRQSVQDITQ